MGTKERPFLFSGIARSRKEGLGSFEIIISHLSDVMKGNSARRKIGGSAPSRAANALH